MSLVVAELDVPPDQLCHTPVVSEELVEVEVQVQYVQVVAILTPHDFWNSDQFAHFFREFL